MARLPGCQQPTLPCGSFQRSIALTGGLSVASIFLSYDRDDSERARHFARALEQAGHNVWWDLHVRGGAQFGKVIEEALKAADAVIVLWSKNSIESAWVRDEAAAGRDSGRLIPVTIDGTEPPLGFRQFQTIDLSKWKGRGTPATLRTLLSDVDMLAQQDTAAGRSPSPQRAPPAPHAVLRPARGALMVIGILLAVLIIGSASYWLIGKRGPQLTTVVVRAADPSPMSQQMAREMLVKLSVLQGSASNNLNLVSGTDKDDPDLRLMLNAAQRGARIHASIALVADRGDAILWSKEMEQPITARAQLEEALAFSAGRVIGCAIEEASGEYGRLSEQLRKTYLNACAALSEVGWDNRAVLPQLKRVTGEAPKFRPAWAKLVSAQADYISTLAAQEETVSAARAELQRYIQGARKVDPHMAEATIAELSLDPNIPVTRAVALVDKAKSDDPDNAAVLNAHAMLMQNVGLMHDAIDDSRHAAQLDPLSPYTRAQLISSLLYGGQIDQARAELAQAKQLWPDVPAIDQADFAIEIRAGDAEKALRQQGNTGAGAALYLKVLREPTEANVDAFLRFIRADPHDLARMGWALQLLGQINRPAEFYALVSEFQPYHFDALRQDSYVLFRPWMASIRRDPRFMELSSKLGIVAYWRTTDKWPDFCREPDIPYDCRKEAAKHA